MILRVELNRRQRILIHLTFSKVGNAIQSEISRKKLPSCCQASLPETEDRLALLSSRLSQLIAQDPLLSDLASRGAQVSLHSVSSALDLHNGRAFRVTVLRDRLDAVPLVLPHDATVRDLKNTFQRAFQERQLAGCRRISWRHVWRSSWLVCDGKKLTTDAAKVADFGVGPDSELTFIKRLRAK